MMKRKNLKEFDYYVLLFFLLAFIGWIWEVLIFLVTNHAFVNRGVYKGPYLPIYGVGGLLLCFLFGFRKEKTEEGRKKLVQKFYPVKVFFLSMIVCSVLEYATSYFLELQWGVRWWDYSGHFLNLNGRICLLGAVLFGLGGTALVCVLLPFYDKLYQKIPSKWRIVLCLLFLAFFIADITYCAVQPNVGEGISFD